MWIAKLKFESKKRKKDYVWERILLWQFGRCDWFMSPKSLKRPPPIDPGSAPRSSRGWRELSWRNFDLVDLNVKGLFQIIYGNKFWTKNFYYTNWKIKNNHFILFWGYWSIEPNYIMRHWLITRLGWPLKCKKKIVTKKIDIQLQSNSVITNSMGPLKNVCYNHEGFYQLFLTYQLYSVKTLI